VVVRRRRRCAAGSGDGVNEAANSAGKRPSMRPSIARRAGIARAVRCGSVSFAAPSFALTVAGRAFEGSDLRAARVRSAARRRLESFVASLAFGCIRRCSRDLCPFVTAGCRPPPGAPRGAASAVGFEGFLPVTRQSLAREPPLPSGFARWLVCRGEYRYSLRTVASEAALPPCRPALLQLGRSSEPPGQLLAPPSTCSRASTPPETSLLPVRSCVSHAQDLVPSSWFRTTSTGFAAPWAHSARLRGWLFRSTRVAGLLHPAADPGVRCVSGRTPGGDCSPSWSTSPRSAVRAPRSSPLHRSLRTSLCFVASSPFSRPRGLAPRFSPSPPSRLKANEVLYSLGFVSLSRSAPHRFELGSRRLGIPSCLRGPLVCPMLRFGLATQPP
jgi:hypothetical protein